MVAFTFYLCHWKYHFWANLVEKIKIVSLSWNLVPRLTWTCRIQWWVLVLFSVLDQIFFFAPKNQNCQFKLKFGTKTNLNMKNSMVMFVFSIFYWKYPFLEEICSKKSKFFVEAGIQTGRIWWWFSSFFFRLEIPFLG